MAFAKLAAALDGLVAQTTSAASRVQEQAASVRQAVSDMEGDARRAETTLSESLSRAQSRAAQARDEIGSIVDGILSRAADQFDDLRSMLENFSGPFEAELKKQLDLLELGGTTVEQILKNFGDAMIEGRRLSELLRGADFGRFKREIQELAAELRGGAVEIDELLRFLNERGGDFGKTVAGWIQAFEDSKISFQRLKDLIDGAQEEFKGTDFDDLLESIENALDSGRGL